MSHQALTENSGKELYVHTSCFVSSDASRSILGTSCGTILPRIWNGWNKTGGGGKGRLKMESVHLRINTIITVPGRLGHDKELLSVHDVWKTRISENPDSMGSNLNNFLEVSSSHKFAWIDRNVTLWGGRGNMFTDVELSFCSFTASTKDHIDRRSTSERKVTGCLETGRMSCSRIWASVDEGTRFETLNGWSVGVVRACCGHCGDEGGDNRQIFS